MTDAIDEVLENEDATSLDRVLQSNPKALSEADFTALVEALRRDRARFVRGEERRKARREGIEDGSEETMGTGDTGGASGGSPREETTASEANSEEPASRSSPAKPRRRPTKANPAVSD